MKLLPFTVSVKDGAPAVAEVGDIEVTVGTGLGAGLTRKVRVLERPLLPEPENGLRVLMKTAPGLAISEAATVAVTVVTLTKAVGMVLPFHWTTVCGTNPWPMELRTVSVKAAPPAFASLGARELIGAPVGVWKVLP